MHILIDGYNLIYAPPQAAGRMPTAPDDRLREQLVSQLAVYREAEGSGGRVSPPRVTLVFDSHPRGRPYPVTEEHLGIEVTYSGPGVEADEAIKEMVRRSDHRRDMVVVTSDNQLRRVCRRLGAQVTDSAAFRDRVRRKLRRREEEEPQEPLVKEEGVPEGEVDAWLEDLGLAEAPDGEPDTW